MQVRRDSAVWALIFSALCVLGYIAWLFSPFHDPEIEGAISVVFLNIPTIFYCVFCFRIVRSPHIGSRVRRSWWVFFLGSIVLILADVLFIAWNRPVWSFADVLYI